MSLQEELSVELERMSSMPHTFGNLTNLLKLAGKEVTFEALMLMQRAPVLLLSLACLIVLSCCCFKLCCCVKRIICCLICCQASAQSDDADYEYTLPPLLDEEFDAPGQVDTKHGVRSGNFKERCTTLRPNSSTYYSRHGSTRDKEKIAVVKRSITVHVHDPRSGGTIPVKVDI